ncbi:hypothetical protein ABIA30_004035 [Mycobacterium sp. MAA66]|uniref:DUF6545 domain-containing protein n=1 Tax=Mycobacterium sp. MAA66 TaxID=3156297 RepID=UPI003516EBAB
MNAGIPVALSVPLLGFICAVLVARLATVNSTTADRRLNVALIFLFVCCLLRHRIVQATIINASGSAISSALLYTLSELAVIPASGALFLLTYSWFVEREPKYLARVVLFAVTAAVLFTLLLELNARAHSPPLAVHTGWAVIAYSSSPKVTLLALVCHDSLTYWYSIMIMTAAVRELCRHRSRSGVAVSAAMAALATGILILTLSISIATVIAATGQHDPYIRAVGRFDRFTVDVFTYVIAVVASIPLVNRVLEACQIDKYSLQRRRLLPLWKDLTLACPETIYLTGNESVNNRSRYRLHRTVIEIRDCILILSRYADHRHEAMLRTIAAEPTLRHAARLALAWSAKAHGHPPSKNVAAQRFAAAELLDETEELCQLADHWDQAKQLVR